MENFSINNVLFVPVHLDALFLEKDTAVTSAKADFTQLPYYDNIRDVNSGTPNISEEVVSKPFANHNLTLKSGMHLHWSLPDALTKGVDENGRIDYPRVPNRWLVQRTKNGMQKRWVIESDYLHPEEERNIYGGVAYPIDLNDPNTPENAVQPFRYLGRQLAFENWKEDNAAEHLEKLTAVGYGEPTFAAFYPNCHRVFGCHDDHLVESHLKDSLTYHVIGWYIDHDHDENHDHDSDPLNKLIKSLTEQDQSIEEIQNAIKEQFEWDTTLNGNNTPDKIYCYAKLTFNPGDDLKHPHRNDSPTNSTKVTLANTGTEALSAYLATDLATQSGSASKGKIEEQLEAIQLFKKLTNKLDISPKFNEALHEKGFTAVNSGKLWAVTPKHEENKASEKSSQIDIKLPAAISHDLNQLNLTQQAYNHKTAEVTSLRQQLFADWYKYMLAAYPPSDSLDNYPDVDAVSHYLKDKSIKLVDAALQEQEELAATLFAQKIMTKSEIEAFNTCNLSRSLLLQKLNDENDFTHHSDVSLPNIQWVDNAPFSKSCLSFNTQASDQDYLHISSQSNVKAISLWVNLTSIQVPSDSNQEISPSYLLYSASGSISTLGIDPLWNRLWINGRQQNPSSPLNWLSLPKDRWVHLYIEASSPLSGEIYLMAKDASNGHLKGKIAGVRLFEDSTLESDVLKQDEIVTDMNMFGYYRYNLQEQEAPRYWQPKEPVVLLAGDAITPSNRHSADGRLHEDGLLHCDTSLIPIPNDFPARIDTLITIINNLEPPNSDEKIGFSQWSNQPWHPFMMEWEVEVLPANLHSNLSYENKGYLPEFITENFTLEEEKPEVTPKSETTVTNHARIYSGSSILTPYAKLSLIDSIENRLNYLKKSDCIQVIGEITQEERASYETALDTWLEAKPKISEDTLAIQKFRAWYYGGTAGGKSYLGKPVVVNHSLAYFSNLEESQKANNLIYTAIQAYQTLHSKSFLSQALSGFNDALLMRKQTLQLPIADPIGFADYTPLTDLVREKVGQENKTAPLPLDSFIPIRAGAMNLLRLHIIDTFGQIKNDFDPKSLIMPERQTATGKFAERQQRDRMLLNPRFVQPTRLNFRWLAANNGEQEMNSHPASSPVCGWLLSNHLDNSLMVYSQEGKALGIIDERAIWEAVPGTDVVTTMNSLNAYLRQLVERLTIAPEDSQATQTDKKNFLIDFITVTDKALENIDAESFAQHTDLALLMGRPIAIVRASMSFELQGKPAVDLGWHAELHHDEGNLLNKSTDQFEQVQVPIRIGERHQLNDGVLGYWEEDQSTALNESFYSTIDRTKVSITHNKIKTYTDTDFNPTQSIVDPVQTLTLLVDPRAKIHATCGVLPTKVIEIPADQYTQALADINITFLSSPILTEMNKLELPLNSEPGYSWSWLQKRGAQWKETLAHGMVTQADFLPDFPDRVAALWQDLINNGWIKPIHSTKAQIVARDLRLKSELSADFAPNTQGIQGILDRGQIKPIDTQARFSDRTEAQEGWLKLQPIHHIES